MSFLRAWEVARTCVLSRRWRHLWASAPCVDLRVWRSGGHLPPPERLARFAYRLLFEREVSAPVDILRVMSSPDGEGEEDYTTSDVQTWIRAAIKRRARVIQLTDHPMDEAFFNLGFVPIISCHLKHLKLSGSLLWNTTLMQLSSQCPALEILELKKCSLHGREISSTSLKSLTMYKDFDEDAIDGSNSDDGEGCTSDSDYDDSDTNTCEYSEIADDYDDEKQCQEHGEGHNQIEDDYDGENQHEEHGEEHNQIGHDEVLGGHNVLHILSNAEILELLADGGEV
ncbi:hypothetical protein OsI_28157 [Oryza sativa Indica Group]|uniref:Uncharacterized protein n=1 Tax=Oryza sativa subsp. indica TaxID=39946 RepID=B8BBM6_ORYSI|nr:hypothetical protein OsI_28157 [Oryza sativa Indica Group]